MGRMDWCTNSGWNDEIEARFFQKLKRARDKVQPLRAQAASLVETHPTVALALLRLYFEAGDDGQRADAYAIQADAYKVLGDVNLTIAALECAVAEERRRPFVKTQAHIEIPFLVASLGLRERYPRALQLLAESKDEMIFPIQHFKWHVASALILAAMNDVSAARGHALSALHYAASTDSGFRRHRSLGLVGPTHDELRAQLLELVGEVGRA